MSKTTVTVTDTAALVSTGPCAFTVKSASPGAQLHFMRAADDADPVIFSVQPEDQFVEYDALSTYLKCSGTVVVIADGELP